MCNSKTFQNGKPIFAPWGRNRGAFKNLLRTRFFSQFCDKKIVKICKKKITEKIMENLKQNIRKLWKKLRKMWEKLWLKLWKIYSLFTIIFTHNPTEWENGTTWGGVKIVNPHRSPSQKCMKGTHFRIVFIILLCWQS